MADVKGPRIRERVKGQAATTVEAAVTPKKATRKIGRPQKSPHEEVLKIKGFNLPVSLIKKIVNYSEKHHNGSASAFAIEVFTKFFEDKNFK